MEKELLEVGDVLYSYHNYGKGVSKHTITKVTNTQAVLDNGATRLRRVIYSSDFSHKKYCNEIGGHKSYYPENEDLKNKYDWWVANRKVYNILKVFDIDNLTTAQLIDLESHLNNLINNKQTI